ncbi:MAG: acyltransferase [Bacteroidia bacterium]|nr:acyltransferase [Bacteroidia bacterium]
MGNSATAVRHSTTDNNNSKIVYLPGLNGLRAIAALAVVISHITLGLGEFGLNNKILGTDLEGNASGSTLAGYGVTIFFTLSGFLITYLLLKEKEVSEVKIKDFYIRRILRIWPLYYLYFAICVAIMIFYGLDITKSSIPFYIFLAANVPFIFGGTLPFLAHYWSLGVEEQFYLLFPQIAKLSNKRLFNISIAIIFIFFFLKFIFLVLDRKYNIHIPYLAIGVTRFHTMLIGVVGAMLYYNNNKIFFQLSTHIVTQMISWTVILLLALNKFHIASVIDGEIVSVITVFLIMGQITKRHNIINLENPFCDFIGKISYGIYVIHPILIFYFSKLLGHFNSDDWTNYLLVYTLITTTTILTAYLSYEFYEKRFLTLKSKYSTVKSVSTKNSP